MFFHETNGIVLHARWLGDPARPLVVFINSLGTDQRIWDAVVPRLVDRYSVLLYDKRGHGLSEAPRGPYTIADGAADLRGLVARIGAARYAIVGLSVGGMIAQQVATESPDQVAALVLCDTATKIGDAATWDARIEAVEYRGLESIAAGVFERWFTPAYREREAVAMRGWHAMLTRQPAGGYAATCAAIRDADLHASSATIRCPTLAVAGAEDLSTPPDLVRGLVGIVPGARFLEIPGAGHLPCIEQPALLADAIVQHLDEAGF